MGGSSSTQTVGYKVYAGIDMKLCLGPIDAIDRIEVGERIIYSDVCSGGNITIDKPELFGGDSREGGISGSVDVEFGESTQEPNSYLCGLLGSLVPAARGIVSVILRQCYLGNNPYIKPWAFWASRIHVDGEGNTQWYDQKAEIPYLPEGDQGAQVLDSGLWKYHWEALGVAASDSAYVGVSYDDSEWEGVYLPAGGVINISTMSETNQNALDNGFRSPPVTSLSINTKVWFRRHVNLSEIPEEDFSWSAYVDNGLTIYVNGTQDYTNYSATGTPMSGTLDKDLFVVGDNVITLIILDDVAATNNVDRIYLDFASNLPGFGGDMNPAHIIRESLTSTRYGLGYSAAQINDDSFMAAADTLFDERMGISILRTAESSTEDFIAEILRHIDAELFVDRVTGKWTLSLIREIEDESALLILDSSSIVAIKDYKVPQISDLTSSVTVVFWDHNTGEDSSVTVSNPVLANIQGGAVNETIQYPGFTTHNTATRAAFRDLISKSTPLISFDAVCDRSAAHLNLGDGVVINWPDKQINNLVMRVLDINVGSLKKSEVILSLVQDRFGSVVSVDSVPVSSPGTGLWVDPTSGSAAAAVPRVFMESPYYTMVIREGETAINNILTDNPDAGFNFIAAGRQGNETNANAYIDNGSGTFVDSAVLDFAAWANLSADVAKEQGPTTAYYESSKDLDLVSVPALASLGDEVVVVTEIGEDSNGSIVTFERGHLDTVPAAHERDSNETLYLLIWDDFVSSDQVEYTASETNQAKIRTVQGDSTLSLANAPTDSLTFSSRANRPYPPGNFQIEGEYFPAALAGQTTITFTWAHRDRTQQTSTTLYSFTASNIGPETNTTYNLRLYDSVDTLIESFAGITGTSQEWNIDSGEFDSQYRVELESERDGYVSFQKHNHTFLSGIDSSVIADWDPSRLPDSNTDSNSSIAWYDFTDTSTLWQDTAGTTPVSADDDAIARIDDLSGNAINLLQSTASLRPTFSSDSNGIGLKFNAVNDYIEQSFGSHVRSFACSFTTSTGLIANSGTPKRYVNFYDSTDPAGSMLLTAESAFAIDETVTLNGGNAVDDLQRTYIRDEVQPEDGLTTIIVNWNGATYDIYINGVMKTTYAGTTYGHAEEFLNCDIISLGDRNGSIGPTGFVFYRSFVFSESLSSTDISNLNSWLTDF